MFWNEWKINFRFLVFEVWSFKIPRIFRHFYFLSKDAQCSETDFLVLEFFFCYIFSVWDMVYFVLIIRSELGTWNFLRSWFRNANQWLPVGKGDSIQKYQGPGGGALGGDYSGQNPQTGGFRGWSPPNIKLSEFVQVPDQFTTHVEHKIHHISKTKNCNKKKLNNYKIRFRTLRIFWDKKNLRIF